MTEPTEDEATEAVPEDAVVGADLAAGGEVDPDDDDEDDDDEDDE